MCIKVITPDEHAFLPTKEGPTCIDHTFPTSWCCLEPECSRIKIFDFSPLSPLLLVLWKELILTPVQSCPEVSTLPQVFIPVFLMMPPYDRHHLPPGSCRDIETSRRIFTLSSRLFSLFLALLNLFPMSRRNLHCG